MHTLARVATCVLCSSLTLCALPSAAAESELRNMGFEESPQQGNTPPAWNFTQHAGEPSFEMVVDRAVAKEGKQSLRLKRTGTQPFGSASQRVQAERYRGKRVRYSAYLRLADINAYGPGILGEISGAALLLRIDANGRDLFFDDMRDRPLRGTRGWTRVAIEADVPADAVAIEFGAQLSGTGTLWVDAAQLEVISTAAAGAVPGSK